MIILGICGPSGSGKTKLADNLCKALSDNHISSYVLSQDSYYKSFPELSFEERELLNFDSPNAFDFEAMAADIISLHNNIPVTKKKYNFCLHLRADTDEPIHPPQVLIFEGIHAFIEDEHLAKIDMLLKVYVDTPADVCLLRRVKRDLFERERNFDSINAQYKKTVRPMLEKYVKHYKECADISVIGGGENMKAVALISAYIISVIRTKQSIIK